MNNITSFENINDFINFLKNSVNEQYKNILISVQLKSIILSVLNNDKSIIDKMLLLEQYSKETARHSCGVALISAALVHKETINQINIEELIKAAMLHDIGKIHIPKNILHNTTKELSPENRKEINKHSVLGKFRILKDNPQDKIASLVAEEHHEWFNGAMGLHSSEINQYARIVTVADVFDALTMKRSYKEAFSIKKSLDIINSENWTHFDPKIVKLLNNITKEFCYENNKKNFLQ